ncbi:MAG: histone deacetylase family protein [Gammaproteobacteria bacterium]|nr:histone deacetylase family protein [Gammaproteobacteria bacterium]
MTMAIVTHPSCRLHDMGDDHPEQPARLGAIHDALLASGLDFTVRHVDAPTVTREQLLRVHDPEYLDLIETVSPTTGLKPLDDDTLMNPHSLEAARHAAGAVIKAVDLVMNDDIDKVFCNVRPPGHHAGHDHAGGFCIYNNVAAGAAYALDAYGLERIAIVDFDVHHGNGTQDIFEGDPRVLFCSSFQHPYYPFSGDEATADNVINIPLPAGTGGEDFRRAVEARWLAPLDAFRPQLVMLSAGFDAHAADPMAQFRLREADFAWITDQARELALRHADGRVVSVLEGGYDLPALGRSVAAHLDSLLGFK